MKMRVKERKRVGWLNGWLSSIHGFSVMMMLQLCNVTLVEYILDKHSQKTANTLPECCRAGMVLGGGEWI